MLAAGAPAWAASGKTTVLVLGDSLSAEYGLKRGTGWVALLEHQLEAQHIPARIVNASISGETTSGGRSRLGALLAQHRPSHVVIELGANDALRGLPLAQTRDNLVAMVRSAQQAGARVLLLGMQLPPNYGKAYAAQFAALYEETARSLRVARVPFFLRGVADASNSAELFQADGIHPREAAQARLLANVWSELRKMLP